MITMKRREVLVCGSAATLPLSSAFQARAATRENMLVVYSQQLSIAKTLANQTVVLKNTIVPLSGDLVRLWTHKISKHPGPIKGYTSWADYILLRGLAEEKGLRLRTEHQVNARQAQSMFVWIMA